MFAKIFEIRERQVLVRKDMDDDMRHCVIVSIETERYILSHKTTCRQSLVQNLFDSIDQDKATELVAQLLEVEQNFENE